jgi:hypothetical protein
VPRFTLCLAILALSACTAPAFGVRVTFDDEADARAATTVEIALTAACPGDATAEPVMPVARAISTRSGSAMALPTVPVGRYGLLGRAWSAECGVVAAGCIDVDLSGAARTLDVALHHVTAGRCVAGDLCTAASGACTASDGGDAGLDARIGDVGPIDAAPFDGGTLDAGPPDAFATDGDSGAVDAGAVDAGRDAGPVTCPPLASRSITEVTAAISSDTTWDCSQIWLLRTEISVVSPAVLTVDPGGVVIAGRGSGGHVGAVLVERGARLVARGTASMPITFTSSAAVGSRTSGDWGGILLSGYARTTQSPGAVAQVNTLSGTTYAARLYGPDVATAPDDTHDCGELQYVRISFTGAAALGAPGTFAALTLAGCGSGTIIDRVQMHRTSDDGLLIYGGTVDLRRVVVSATEEDVIDWNYGWGGRVQYLVGWQWPASELGETGARESGNLFEADGGGGTPTSSPTMYNLTFLAAPGIAESLLRFSSGTEGTFRSMLVEAPSTTAPPLADVCNSAAVAAATSGALSIANSMMTDRFATTESCVETFDERAWACGAVPTTRCTTTSTGVAFVTAGDYTMPELLPSAAVRALCAATPPAGAFFEPEGAMHCGAIGTTDWTDGWTAFPRN